MKSYRKLIREATIFPRTHSLTDTQMEVIMTYLNTEKVTMDDNGQYVHIELSVTKQHFKMLSVKDLQKVEKALDKNLGWISLTPSGSISLMFR